MSSSSPKIASQDSHPTQPTDEFSMLVKFIQIFVFVFCETHHCGAFIHVTCIHLQQSIHSLTHSNFFTKDFIFKKYITQNNRCNHTPLITGIYAYRIL